MQSLLTRRYNCFCWFVNGLLLWLLPVLASANHIIGGNVSMRAVGTTPGQFQVQLTQFWDVFQSSAGNQDPVVTVLIFSKNGPRLIERIDLRLCESLPLRFNNEACARQNKLNFIEARYCALVTLDPARYADPAGYYMVWERCCRSDAIINVTRTSSGLGMVFYMEFPAMTRNSTPFVNSSPQFKIPTGDYICLDKPFTFDISATDADGDELVYSLVTPLNGYTTNTVLTATTTPRASYPPVGWAPGYGLNNVIPGNPALSVDAATGQLSVRASREGLYLFSVQCEEFRNGQRIGSVRRDFQLPVVDCGQTNTPPPLVSVNSRAVSGNLPWCASQPLTLRAETNPSFQYQWQRNGSNLPGATTDSLQVRTAGVYTVVKSLILSCARDTISEKITVSYVTPPPVSLSLASPNPLCAGDTIQLRTVSNPDYTYRWQRDGVNLTGQQGSTLLINQSGRYTVLARPSAANCEGMDSIRVTINPRPTVQVSASQPVFCPGDSVVLTAVGQPGNQYQWQRDGSRFGTTTARVLARETGLYRAVVTASTGCTALSAQLALTQYPRPDVRLASLAPFCGVGGTAQTLNGLPGGGVYAGPGVTGNRFDPAMAGVGRHTLTYTVTSANGCRTVQSTTATVAPGPQLTGLQVYTLFRGSRVELEVNTSEPIRQYGWNPPDFLSRADVPNPIASPSVTTPYQLTALSVLGCPVSFSVLVEVVEPVYIPSAFSPNGDGLNDVWTIANIEKFPGCEVSIFSRWGELVFYSRGYAQPWNGSFGQNKAGVGLYTYQIKTSEGPFSTTFRGALTVLP